MPRLRILIAGLASASAATVLTPTSTSAVEYVDYRVMSHVCKNDGTSIDIGGGIFMKEIGKHGVQQLRAKWLVYYVDTTPGIPVAVVQKTKESGRFANDERSYYWNQNNGAFHKFTGLSAASGPYKLVVKMTWDRSGGRSDWNHKVDVAYCG